MNKFTKISTKTTYEVNGVRYERLEDMPQEHRKFFEDKDGNGIPDFIESFTEGSQSVMRIAQHRIDNTMLGGDADMIDLLKRNERIDDASTTAALRCSGCGFDLREAKVGGQCPKCGQQVSRSINRLAVRTTPSSRFEFIFDHTGLIGTLVIIVIAVAYLIYAFRSIVF